MNTIKYQKLSKNEMSKLTGGRKRWVKFSTEILSSECVQTDEEGRCIVVFTRSRETWHKVNSKGEILKIEYRPD